MDIRKNSTLTIGVLLLALTLSACSSGASDPGEPTPTPTISTSDEASRMVPVSIDPAAITQDQRIEVKVGNSIDLAAAPTPEIWSGISSVPEVAQFTPGAVEENSGYNPGIFGLSVGESTIELTNTQTGAVVNFIVSVTESDLPDGATP